MLRWGDGSGWWTSGRAGLKTLESTREARIQGRCKGKYEGEIGKRI